MRISQHITRQGTIHIAGGLQMTAHDAPVGAVGEEEQVLQLDGNLRQLAQRRGDEGGVLHYRHVTVVDLSMGGCEAKGRQMLMSDTACNYYTTERYTEVYCTALYYTTLYYAILYYTVLYYTILYYTILYYT